MTSRKGLAIVIMGVSGAGKSTIGGMLAKVMDVRFLDADDYHPQSNIDKMKNGVPLTDDDRIPWLETLGDILKAHLSHGDTVILGCSSLKGCYREILRQADANYVRGSYECGVKFVLLDVSREILAARLEKRASSGNHFMPAILLQSQMDLLHVDESEGIHRVDASTDPQSILKNIRTFIASFNS